MGHYQKIIWALIVLLIYSGCNRPDAPDCFQRAGKDGTLAQSLTSFTTLHLIGHLHFVLHQDSVYKSVMEGPENLLPEIDFHYNDNTLTIRNLNTCNIVRSYKREITVHLYAPEFPHIINESTLAIDTPDTLKQKSMHWEQWQASSNAFLLIHCDSAHFEMPTGHGDLEVAGIAHQLKVYSHSIGIFDGRHLKSQSLQCNQSSLQDLYVHNNGYAYFEITNSGNVYYTGTPAQIEKKITGTGEIIPLP